MRRTKDLSRKDVETILGAIAIDSRWDTKVLQEAVTKMCSLEDEMDDLAKRRKR